MDIEFDEAKSALNLKKHGIDFESAQSIFDDPDLLLVPARLEDEPRWMGIGSIRGRVWAVIFTIREQRVRFISVRRARPSEVRIYEGS